jgi:tetratricopeptide (TPR) repeat protein
MKLHAHWPSALEAARLGDLGPARLARRADPTGSLADYFYGRCLAEADCELDEAIALLRGARAAERGNLLVIQALALALARSGDAGLQTEAGLIWQEHGLPHDLDLLGQVSLTLEAQTRAWPESSATAELPWPEGLPQPSVTEPSGGEPATGQDPLTQQDSDKMAPRPATKSPGFFERRKLARIANQLEDQLLNHQAIEVLRQAADLVSRGIENGEVHLVAGLAAEEAGEPRRARAHLARAVALDPSMLLARTWLGRVYWRCGWVDLALALWRSLPVEGPYDHGRHYHLALGHEAAGDRPAALQAMAIALDQFYFDTRHFFVKRALEEWEAKRTPGKEGASLPGGTA